MPRLPLFDCDVIDARDVQCETLFVAKREDVLALVGVPSPKFALVTKDGTVIAVANKIRSLTKYAHGERCVAVRIDSAIEDD